jgi:hypothetical protein
MCFRPLRRKTSELEGEEYTSRLVSRIRYNIVRTDREADYMCFSPLRRKTSELEGEEYTSRLVSGIT